LAGLGGNPAICWRTEPANSRISLYSDWLTIFPFATAPE
jgi:hypothetical protein